MNISFIESKLLSLSFQIEQQGLKDNFSLKYTNGFSADDKNQFIVKFDVGLTTTKGVSIALEYIGLFRTEGTITEDFKKGKFATVDAPTMIFPYLRSFITTLTVNAGLPPIILPAVSFRGQAR